LNEIAWRTKWADNDYDWNVLELTRAHSPNVCAITKEDRSREEMRQMTTPSINEFGDVNKKGDCIWGSGLQKIGEFGDQKTASMCVFVVVESSTFEAA